MEAATALPTVMGMAGSMNAGAGAQAAAQYNAATQQAQANASLAQAAEDERRGRISAKKSIGAQRASVGASGVQMEGSALDLIEESASNAELDALTIRHGGEMKAWAYRAGASLDLLKGDNAKTEGNFGAAIALGKGIESAASKAK